MMSGEMVLETLAAIQEQANIFAILFRNAGVALQFYEGPEEQPENWRDHLVIHRYYPTLAEALTGEHEHLLAQAQKKKEEL